MQPPASSGPAVVILLATSAFRSLSTLSALPGMTLLAQRQHCTAEGVREVATAATHVDPPSPCAIPCQVSAAVPIDLERKRVLLVSSRRHVGKWVLVSP